MPMTTQCGRCGRRFAVYAQEFRLHHGRVECPQCGHHFDALDALLDEPLDGRPREPLAEVSPGQGASSARDRLGLGPPVKEAPPARPRGRAAPVATGLLALLLTVGLAAQALWWTRGQVLRDPTMRQALEGLCQRLGCQIPRPRLPGALTLLDPSLTPGPEGEALRLRLKIRNEADLDQAAPLLEFELLDLQGDLAAIRRFSPAEYVPGRIELLAPRQTLEVELSLVAVGEVPAGAPAGFRVRLL